MKERETETEMETERNGMKKMKGMKSTEMNKKQ